MPIVIVGIFYSYEFITGSHSFLVDIMSFFISIIVGQIISFKLLIQEQKPKYMEFVAFTFIMVLIVGFIVFTFYPPHLDIFKGSVTGKYGIEFHN